MSAGVAGRPLVGGDLSMVVPARSSGDGLGGLLAQGIAAELEPVGIVDDTIEDRVGEGRIADQVVPAIDRDLAGDQRGATPVALLDDLEQVGPFPTVVSPAAIWRQVRAAMRVRMSSS
jgi:hypothetical protein